MRIIHTADLHLGTTTYGTEDPSTGLNRRVQDFFAAFDQCVDYAIEKRADALLLCGDTFKDISPSSTLLKMFAIRLRRLTSEGVKVLMLLGNHDSHFGLTHQHTLNTVWKLAEVIIKEVKRVQANDQIMKTRAVYVRPKFEEGVGSKVAPWHKPVKFVDLHP